MDDLRKTVLSWLGRTGASKMMIRPKINFLFMMILKKISEEELEDWQNMINTFFKGEQGVKD